MKILLFLVMVQVITYGCSGSSEEDKATPENSSIDGSQTGEKESPSRAKAVCQPFEEPPPAWHVVAEYPKGLNLVIRTYSSEEEAEEYLKGADPESWEGNPKFVVRKDAPDLQVRIDGIPLLQPHDITVRNNWIRRNQERLKPVLSEGKPAYVITWKSATSTRTLANKRGGEVPFNKNEPWPDCAKCTAPLRHICTLDFRIGFSRAEVPGDLLCFFYCTECHLGECCQIKWVVDSGEVVYRGPKGVEQKEYLGTPWKVTDYPDTLGLFFDDSGEPSGDDPFLGHSPYISLTVYGTKIGGHLFWIQYDETPACRCKLPMRFLGQSIGNEEIQFGDSGIAYFFHCASNECKESKVIIQCF